MPYGGAGGKPAPSYVPAAKKSQWVAVWNSVYKKTGSEEQAFKAANGAIKKVEEGNMDEELLLIIPIERLDEEKQIVYGWAQTINKASDGLVITAAAMRGAVSDYFDKGPALREMHMGAAGKVLEAQVYDAKGTFIAARVVDPIAWLKVKEGVYTAFSIAGRIEQFNEDYTQVEKFKWIETSLVDRPADPGAKITLWQSEDRQTQYDINEIMKGETMGKPVEEKVEEPTKVVTPKVEPEPTPIVRAGGSGDEPAKPGDAVVHEVQQGLARIEALLTKAFPEKEPEPPKKEEPAPDPSLARFETMEKTLKDQADALEVLRTEKTALEDRLKKVEEVPVPPKVRASYAVARAQEEKIEANHDKAAPLFTRLQELSIARSADVRAYEQNGSTKEALGILGQLNRLGYDDKAIMKEVGYEF